MELLTFLKKVEEIYFRDGCYINDAISLAIKENNIDDSCIFEWRQTKL